MPAYIIHFFRHSPGDQRRRRWSTFFPLAGSPSPIAAQTSLIKARLMAGTAQGQQGVGRLERRPYLGAYGLHFNVSCTSCAGELNPFLMSVWRSIPWADDLIGTRMELNPVSFIIRKYSGLTVTLTPDRLPCFKGVITQISAAENSCRREKAPAQANNAHGTEQTPRASKDRRRGSEVGGTDDSAHAILPEMYSINGVHRRDIHGWSFTDRASNSGGFNRES